MTTVEIDDDVPEELDDLHVDLDNPGDILDDDPPKPEPDDDEPKDSLQKNKGDEEESYSRKVQKRIDKLVAERNIERQRAQDLESRLERMERRFEDADVAYEQTALQDKVSQLRKLKVEAMEMGEFDKVAEIDDEIMELRTKSKKPQPARQPQPQQATALPDAQKEWLAENDWFYNPAKAALREKANAVYLKMVNDEGFDPHDSDTYAELSTRINAKRTQAPPPAGVNRGGAASGNVGKKITAEDVRKMRDWGLDPNDATARAEYMKNKRGG